MNKKIIIESEKEIKDILDYFNKFYTITRKVNINFVNETLKESNKYPILIVSYNEYNEVKLEYCSCDKDINIKEYCNKCNLECVNYTIIKSKDFL